MKVCFDEDQRVRSFFLYPVYEFAILYDRIFTVIPQFVHPQHDIDLSVLL